MNRTVFHIAKMDCPAEENLIRLRLQGIDEIKHLDFDLNAGQLEVIHLNSNQAVLEAIRSLNLGESILSFENLQDYRPKEEYDQRRLLRIVLGVNIIFFFIESIWAYFSASLGLFADSLDMLADSFVYGISLMAVGSSLIFKKRVARWAAYLQFSLALLGFFEVVRRFLNPDGFPDYLSMLVVSFLALIANAFCLYLLQNSRSKDQVHLKASKIFTSNDIIINLGVMLAAVLVNWTKSPWPDLLIGSIVFALVLVGASRIFKLGK